MNQTEIPEAYAISDVLVLPSDGGETWGLVVNEAMASGLPVLVSEAVGCVPDLVHGGQTGHAFPCGDVDQMADLMVEMASSRTKLDQMGAFAKRHAGRYSVDAAVDGVLRALASCAKWEKRRDESSIDRRITPADSDAQVTPR